MSMSLYDLSANYLQAMDFLSDPENDIDAQTIADTIEGLDGDLESKMLAVGKYIDMLEKQAEDVAEVYKRQRDRAKSLETKAASLRAYLISNMQSTGKSKLQDPEISLSLAKLPASVQVLDESLIPAEFWKEKVEVTIDKTAIKNAGGCEGVKIESTGFRLAIK